jgi:hypothetical protein
MSATRKRRPSKKQPDYTPSAADAFPFGAPSSSKDNTAKAVVSPEDSQAPRPSMADSNAQHRPATNTATKKSVDATMSKDQKTAPMSKDQKTAPGSDVTASASSQRKRKVTSMAGSIDDLSLKQSKVQKHSHEYATKKREAPDPVFTNRLKKVKANDWNVDDDGGMEDALLDTAPAVATETKTTSRIKRAVPISLESLAREEEAAKAGKTAAPTAVPTAVPQAKASDPSLVDLLCKCVTALSFNPN